MVFLNLYIFDTFIKKKKKKAKISTFLPLMVHFFVLVFFCLGSELDVFAYGVNDKCIYYVFLVYLHIYLKETSWISL